MDQHHRLRSKIGPGAVALPSAAVLLLFFAAPVVALLVYAFLTSGTYAFNASAPVTLSNFSKVWSAPQIGTLLGNTLVVGVVASVVTVGIALPCAYWLRYRAGALRVPILAAVVVALFASYIVRIYAWRTILGTHGVLNSALESVGVISSPLHFLIYSRFAIIVAMVHLMLPVVLMMMFAAFRPLEPRFLEAAQDLGAGAWLRWRRIVLPLVAEPVTQALFLVFVLTTSDYVTPQLLGGPHDSMLGVQVQNYFQTLGDFGDGAALGMTILAGYLAIYLLLRAALRALRCDRIAWGA
jgi:spermidine/putrescine transport system permease protein